MRQTIGTMTSWIRGPDDPWWHVGRVAQSGVLSTQCGTDIGAYATDLSSGWTPPGEDRCLTCDVRMVMEQRRARLMQTLGIDRLLTAWTSRR